MKRILFAAALLAAGPAVAQPAPTVSMEVSATDLAIYATAIRAAASQCGADHELACQVGMAEKAQLEKLNAAAKALADKTAKTAAPAKPADKSKN